MSAGDFNVGSEYTTNLLSSIGGFAMEGKKYAQRHPRLSIDHCCRRPEKFLRTKVEG
jgi:hypothetical protein